MKTFCAEEKRKAGLVVLLLVMALVPRSAAAQSYCNNPTPACPGNTCNEPDPPDPKCESTECPKCTKSPCYVSSGTYVTSATDLTLLTAAGSPLVMARSYQSTRLIDGPLGLGWMSSLTARIFYATYLYAAPSTYQHEARIIMPDGAQYRFVDNGNARENVLYCQL